MKIFLQCMWKDLGLDSVKKGLDTLVKKVGVVDQEYKAPVSQLTIPRSDDAGQFVAYMLREAPEEIGENLEEDEEISIFQIPVVGKKLTVGDIRKYFPIPAGRTAGFVFRFKIEDDLFEHVFIEGLGDQEIAPTYRGNVVLNVLRCPVPFRRAEVKSVPSTSSTPPNREELVKQRLEAEAAQVKAAREFAANNALEEANRRQEKLAAQSLLGAELDRWAFTEQGKYKDVRSLLSSMNSVLWLNSGWTDVALGELMTNEAVVKKTYRKAIVLTHPDRHQKESADQQYRADRVFNAINESYKIFTSGANPS